MARQEAGQLRLDRREIDRRKVVHDAVALFPVPVAWIAPVEPVQSLVDEARLLQSVLALLQTTRSHGGPTIRITVIADEAQATITVEDDGTGMSIADMAQAFDRFCRGPNAMGKALEGSGLGLPVVKSIVEAHGGTVALSDATGGGLRATLRIPRRAPVRLVWAEAEAPRLRA